MQEILKSNVRLPKICTKPVFVVGAARSGTTWVQCLISSHPDFISCPETHIFDMLLYPYNVCGGYQLHYPTHIWRGKLLFPSQLERSFEQIQKGFIRLSEETKKNLMEASSRGSLTAASYLNSIMYECSNVPDAHGKRWVEKTPIHIHYLEDIFYWFPQAKVVCVIRNPVDVVLSAYSNMRVPLGVSFRDYVRSYQQLRLFLKRCPERRGSIFSVFYEDIKNEPQSLIRLFNFLEVSSPDIPSILARSKEEFIRLYRGTELENLQPKMEDRQTDILKSANQIDERYLREIIYFLLPKKNHLWERYMDLDIDRTKSRSIKAFYFLLKHTFKSAGYIIKKRMSCIKHLFLHK